MSAQVINSAESLQRVLGEEWRRVPGLSVEVSSHGRVRTLRRAVGTCYGATRIVGARLLSTKAGKSGYVRIHQGIAGTQFVHRLVAMAFVPNPNRLPVVNHIDGNKANNWPENLEWCTQGDNVRHGFRTGLTPIRRPGKGNDSPAAKLTEDEVRCIKQCLAEGQRSIDLARRFGVCKNTIAEIKAGRSWGHVPCN